MIIAAVKVFSIDNEISCHVVSFIELEDDKIIAMNEYWGDDGKAPQWRIEMNLGTVIC